MRVMACVHAQSTQKKKKRNFSLLSVIEQKTVVSFSFVLDEHACTCLVSGEFCVEWRYAFSSPRFLLLIKYDSKSEEEGERKKKP